MENILKEIQKQNDRPLEEQDFHRIKKEGRISEAHADVVVSCLLFFLPFARIRDQPIRTQSGNLLPLLFPMIRAKRT